MLKKYPGPLAGLVLGLHDRLYKEESIYKMLKVMVINRNSDPRRVPALVPAELSHTDQGRGLLLLDRRGVWWCWIAGWILLCSVPGTAVCAWGTAAGPRAKAGRGHTASGGESWLSSRDPRQPPRWIRASSASRDPLKCCCG